MSRFAPFPATPTGLPSPERAPRRRAVTAVLAAALLCVSAISAFPAEAPLLAEAARLEQAGDSEGAIRIYRAWLKDNTEDPARVDTVFAALFRLEPNLSELLELSATPGLGPQPLLALSKLAEMSGRSEEARALSERAWKGGGGAEALVAYALLALEMNDAAAATGALDVLRAHGEAWANLVDGYSDLAAEQWDRCRETLGRAAEGSDNPRIALAALWGLYECSRRSGDAGGMAAAAAGIGRRFPGSPEEALAAGRASPWPNPAQFAAPSVGQAAAAVQDGSPSAQAASAAVQTGSYAVQAGSFATRENADELAADLSKKGFAPVVRQETRDGKTLFKLYAGVGMDRDAAVSLAENLRKAGYAGFVISEAR